VPGYLMMAGEGTVPVRNADAAIQWKGDSEMSRFNITRATLLALLFLAGIAVVAWGGTGTQKMDKTTARVVELELTFTNGDMATVRQLDSAPITIDDHGKLLSIIPIARNVASGSIELEISMGSGNETRSIGRYKVAG